MQATATPTLAPARDVGVRARSRRPWGALLLPYLLIAPTMLLVTVFTLWPALNSLSASLWRPGSRLREPRFVGLGNFADLFDSTHYIGASFTVVLGNTLTFAAVTVGVGVPLALLFALLLARPMRLRGLWRFGIFYPALLPMIGAASLWAFIFADGIGVIDAVMTRTVGTRSPNWLGDPFLSLWAVSAVNVWKQASYLMIFFLAGLQGIPRDVYEAAALDGAVGVRALWHITLPLLRRTTLFVLVVAFTFAFQTVEHLPALGHGGPGVRSNLLLYYLYQTIPERQNWGYVNAMTVVLVGIVLAFTLANLAVFERGGRDDA